MLIRKYHHSVNHKIFIVLASDSLRFNQMLKTLNPDFVYHEAALKSLSLNKTSPNESIKNDVMDIYKSCNTLLKCGLKIFVLKITDIPINSINIYYG